MRLRWLSLIRSVRGCPVKCDVSMASARTRRVMWVWFPPTASRPRRRRTSYMVLEALTASSRIFRVQRFPSCSKCEVSTPSWFMRLRTYSREPLLGSTPRCASASVSVRAPAAASARRSFVYGLIGMPAPLRMSGRVCGPRTG
ncbi:hypothetical protein VR43_29655 [Streptomyces sp. NRRL S-104]|nr:hypothetical protein VR43_29655 [Streptomyces sp. NRRL S-104]